MSEERAPTIVACVKISVDTAQLQADALTSEPLLADAPRRLGTFDEHALEEALRLREGGGGRVLTLTLTPDAPQELLLRALAMGADEAHVVEDATAGEADALATATVLEAGLRGLGPWDLVLCGEGSLDAYDRQVGPRLGEALGVPVLTHVSALDLRGPAVVARRSLEDRIETVEVSLPLVACVGAEINEPRLPTVLQILGASGKPVVRRTLAELGLDVPGGVAGLAATRTLASKAPPVRRAKERVPGDTPAEMAAALAEALLTRGLLEPRR